MKKNKMLRMASALLVLTLLTTSVIGGTFAKYTTTATANDTARVAKWGVVITASGSLYSDAYAKANVADGTGNLPAAWSSSGSADSISVVADAENDNIVAPGTKSYGNGLSFGISGKPEVAVSVKTTIKAEDIFLAAGTYGVLVPATVSDDESLKKVCKEYPDGVYHLEADETYSKVGENTKYINNDKYYGLTNKIVVEADYFPVVYTLGGTTSSNTDAKTAVKVAEKLANAVKTGVVVTDSTDYKITYEDISQTFNANTNLKDEGPKFGDENLKWEWEYGDGPTDMKDTILGNLIAARGASADYVVVSIGADDAVTPLKFSTDDDFTVKSGNTVVANLQTKFDITLTVTQVD